MNKKNEEIEKVEKVEKVEKIENIKDDEIMTVGEVAGYFKIHEHVIAKLVQDGEIPAFKIGGHWRIKKSDLGEFIEGLKQGKEM